MQSPAIVSKEGSDQSNDINVDLDSVRSWIKTAGLGSHSDFFLKKLSKYYVAFLTHQTHEILFNSIKISYV